MTVRSASSVRGSCRNWTVSHGPPKTRPLPYIAHLYDFPTLSRKGRRGTFRAKLPPDRTPVQIRTPTKKDSLSNELATHRHKSRSWDGRVRHRRTRDFSRCGQRPRWMLK
jgi:hypothetical protein